MDSNGGDATRNSNKKPNFQWRPNFQIDPNFQGSSSFQGEQVNGMPPLPWWKSPRAHYEDLRAGLSVYNMWNDEGRLLLELATYIEELMLRTILLQVLQREVEDGELGDLVLRAEHPNGDVSYHLKSLGTEPSELSGSLLLRRLSNRDQLPPITMSMKVSYGEWVSPYFVRES